MGHSVQLIVAPTKVAETICNLYPTLSPLATPAGFSLVPIDADFIDDVVRERPPQKAGEAQFKLLTAGFVQFLRELSRLGPIAYVETDYFGGKGGQGALAYADSKELMVPEWGEIGPIDRALELIGVPRSKVGDRFSAVGLDGFRSNDEIFAAAGEGDSSATP